MKIKSTNQENNTTANQDMLQSPKIFHSPNLPHPSSSQTQKQNIPISPKFPLIKQCSTISRRALTIGTTNSLLLLPFFMSSKAEAEEEEDGHSFCTGKNPTKLAFLDISIDGEPVGRIIIGLYGNDSPLGVARFSNLVSGAAGISYRRKDFVKITSNYVQHGGVRSYGVDFELAKRNGNELVSETLKDEWERVNEKCSGIKNLAGAVGIIVRDPLKPPPKLKLVARQGKLEVDQEQVGTGPNGTEFTISVKDSPELDDSALVIGTVLEGMEVVERIAQVKTVKDNTTSPYFRVAKLIGDKRAIVAERGFNRPYSKVIVTNCGLLKQ